MNTIIKPCLDCPETIVFSKNGFPPMRCPECTRKFRIASRMARTRLARGTPVHGGLWSKTCNRCGRVFSFVRKKNTGPQLCPDCKQQSIRMTDRLRKREKRHFHLTLSEWKLVLEAFDYQCVYCQKQLDNLEMDHFIPFVSGGLRVMGNVVPACRSCNARKQTKHPSKFMDSQRFDEVVNVLAELCR